VRVGSRGGVSEGKWGGFEGEGEGGGGDVGQWRKEYIGGRRTLTCTCI